MSKKGNALGFGSLSVEGVQEVNFDEKKLAAELKALGLDGDEDPELAALMKEAGDTGFEEHSLLNLAGRGGHAIGDDLDENSLDALDDAPFEKELARLMGVAVEDLDPEKKAKKAAEAAAAAHKAVYSISIPVVSSDPTTEEEEELADPHVCRLMESFDVLEWHKTEIEAEMALLKKEKSPEAHMRYEDLNFELSDLNERISVLQDAVESGSLSLDDYRKKVEDRLHKDLKLLAFMSRDASVFGADSIKKLTERIQIATDEIKMQPDEEEAAHNPGRSAESEQQLPIQHQVQQQQQQPQPPANTPSELKPTPAAGNASKSAPIGEMSRPVSYQWMASFEVLTAYQEALEGYLSTPPVAHALLANVSMSQADEELTQTMEVLASIQERIESGELSIDAYSESVKQRLAADKILAVSLKSAGRVAEALSVLRRIKIAEDELKSAEDQAEGEAKQEQTAPVENKNQVDALNEFELELKEKVVSVMEKRLGSYMSCIRCLMAFDNPEIKNKAVIINDKYLKPANQILSAFKTGDGSLLAFRLKSKEDQKRFISTLPPKFEAAPILGDVLENDARKKRLEQYDKILTESSARLEGHVLRLMRTKDESLKKSCLPLHALMKKVQTQLQWVKKATSDASIPVFDVEFIQEESVETVDVRLDEEVPIDQIWIEIHADFYLPDSKNGFSPCTLMDREVLKKSKMDEMLEFASTGRVHRRPITDRSAATSALNAKLKSQQEMIFKSGSTVIACLDYDNTSSVSISESTSLLKSAKVSINENVQSQPVTVMKIPITPLLSDMQKLKRAVSRFKLGIEIETPKKLAFLRGNKVHRLPGRTGRSFRLDGLLSAGCLEAAVPVEGDEGTNLFVRVRAKKAFNDGTAEVVKHSIKYSCLQFAGESLPCPIS